MYTVIRFYFLKIKHERPVGIDMGVVKKGAITDGASHHQ